MSSAICSNLDQSKILLSELSLGAVYHYIIYIWFTIVRNLTGMKAGDNTMNSTLALYLLSTMDSLDPGHVKDSKDLQEEVLQHYLQFLITPNQHKDTYVHYCHRAFVKDWASLPDKIESPKELGKFCSSR